MSIATAEKTNRKRVPKALFFYVCELLANLDDFLTLVMTAGFAYAVSKIVSAALGALSEARKGQLPCAGTSLISASLRHFSLRYCHLKTLLLE